MANIGFLVIGAPKAGTTSLFEYLRAHPQIHMPAEKELYFFNMDRNYRRGFDWYRTAVLGSAPPGAVCGEATTEYMSGVPYTEGDDGDRSGGSGDNGDRVPVEHDIRALEELIPSRIRAALPDVRLLCVLRDPVERARSHYRMMALGRDEHRPFEQAIDELIDPINLTHARSERSRTNGYVVNGEYARLLSGFLRVFPQEQLKVIFSDELAEHPAQTVRELFDFIGVDAEFLPANIQTRYRAAALRQRIPGLNLVRWQMNLARVDRARGAWHALPASVRRTIDHAYNVANHQVEMWNARRGELKDEMQRDVREQLRAHYRADSETLGEMLGRPIPWLAAWDA